MLKQIIFVCILNNPTIHVVVEEADLHQLSSSHGQHDGYVFLPPTGHIMKCMHHFTIQKISYHRFIEAMKSSWKTNIQQRGFNEASVAQ